PVVAGAANGHEGEAHEDPGGHGIHMPSPSYFPLIAALGFPIMATGLIYDYALVAVGAAVLFVGIYGWALEPATEGEEASAWRRQSAPPTSRPRLASTTASSLCGSSWALSVSSSGP